MLLLCQVFKEKSIVEHSSEQKVKVYLEQKVPLTLTTTEVAITFSAAGRAADNHKYQKPFTILRTNVDLVIVVY